MLIGSIFLVLALAAVVTVFIILPLWEQGGTDELIPRQEVKESEHQRSALLAERDRLLNALQELDSDNELGKIPAGEYAPARTDMLREAAAVLRSLDELNLAFENNHNGAPVNQPAEDDLEALIARRRHETAARHDEQVLAADRPAGTAIRQAYCTQCGKPVMSGDKFCPACGAKVSA